MDFTFSEEQDAVRDLATQVFEGRDSRACEEVERSEERVDRELWRALADAGLLAIAVPEEHGGSGSASPSSACSSSSRTARGAVPLWPTLVLGAFRHRRVRFARATAGMAAGGRSGEIVLTAALAEPGANDPLRPQVTATATAAPGGSTARSRACRPPTSPTAARARVDRRRRGRRVPRRSRRTGVERSVAATTDRSKVAHLAFAGALASARRRRSTGVRAAAWMLDRALVGLCATQVGVAEARCRWPPTTRRNASSSGGRCRRSRASRSGRRRVHRHRGDAGHAVAGGVAAHRRNRRHERGHGEVVGRRGQRVVHITQHLHGGMGADVDYPVHRYFRGASRSRTRWAARARSSPGSAERSRRHRHEDNEVAPLRRRERR